MWLSCDATSRKVGYLPLNGRVSAFEKVGHLPLRLLPKPNCLLLGFVVTVPHLRCCGCNANRLQDRLVLYDFVLVSFCTQQSCMTDSCECVSLHYKQLRGNFVWFVSIKRRCLQLVNRRLTAPPSTVEVPPTCVGGSVMSALIARTTALAVAVWCPDGLSTNTPPVNPVACAGELWKC